MSTYQPKTGAKCGCKRGVQRDNCPRCEGTGMVIDFKAIREKASQPAALVGGAQFTPGPWYSHLAKADHCLSSSVWGPEQGNQIAVIGGKSLQTMNANANLIAAAPAMYADAKQLCELVRDFMNDNRLYDGQVIQAISNLETALSQAEGR